MGMYLNHYFHLHVCVSVCPCVTLQRFIPLIAPEARDAAVAHLLSVGPIFKGSDVAQVRVTVGTERFSFSKRSYTSASYKNCGTMTLT